MAVNIEKCRKKMVKFHAVPPSKYEYNDPNEKNYWKALINEVEKLGKKKAKASRIKRIDLWTVLPPKLQERVSKYVPIPPESALEPDEDNWDDIDDLQDLKKIHEHFNESTLSEILEQERTYHEVKVRLDPRPEKREKEIRNINWTADFMEKNRKDRIKWKSKLYKLDKDILEKPLFEQAEEIMDQAASSFAEWVNALGTKDNEILTKDLIKELFSIEMSEGVSAAIHVAPKQVKAVPNEVAMTWKLPKMSLEMQVEKHLKEKEARKGKKPQIVAFGRTLPMSMRPWVPSGSDKQLKAVFPEELRTAETLFKGIGHLRSTRALVDYYLEHEELQRPLYLVETGSFKPQAVRQSTDHIPLYERFRLNKN